jgi:general secretion pathway protein D
LLKVVDNLVYFEVVTTAGTISASGLIARGTTNTTPKTVAIGVVMAVTPQISDDGRVSLTVRPSITRLQPSQPFVNDPNPELAAAGQVNLVPQVQTREMESVLQVGSGQTVILGGLMQDDARRRRRR